MNKMKFCPTIGQNEKFVATITWPIKAALVFPVFINGITHDGTKIIKWSELKAMEGVILNIDLSTEKASKLDYVKSLIRENLKRIR